MGDLLFVWTAVSNMFRPGIRTTLAQRLVNPLFDRCLIKLVLTVWPLTSTSACLVTKQCLMMYGHQTFPVWTGLYWGLRQTSDRKAAPKNDGHLGYTDTLT